MKKKYLLPLIAVVMLVPIISGYSQQSEEIVNAKIENELPIQSNEDARAAQQVLEDNLRCANTEDADGYVQTLVPKARENTKKEMEEFFHEFDVENSLLSFEMLKLEQEHMLVETKIKTVNKSDDKEYRDHIATANQTFVYQEGQWLIEQTVMIDTEFLR